MLCTTATNTSNRITTQTGAAERHSSGLDSNTNNTIMATYADNNATSAGYDQLFAWAKPRCGVCGTKLHDF